MIGGFVNYSEKLEGLPTIHYPSLIEYPERQEFMRQQFEKFGITKTKLLLTDRYEKIKDKYTLTNPHDFLNPERFMCHPGNIISYLALIKDWYDNSDEEYAIFCDDDMDFMSIDYWTFSWREFVDALPKNWQCIDLVRIQEWDGYQNIIHNEEIIPSLNLRIRKWHDWGTAMLITKGYAKKILDRHYVSEYVIDTNIVDDPATRGGYIYYIWPLIENVLYKALDDSNVYNFPLLLEKADLISFLKQKTSTEEEYIRNRIPHMISRDVYERLWVGSGPTLKLSDMITL